MTDKIDVLGIGSVTIDDFLIVETYPPADVKMPILSRHRQIGGLIATALVAASRLGCSASYASVLGYDDLSLAVISGLGEQGVDLSHAVRRTDAQPLHAFIVVGSQPPTRTIFFEKTGLCGADPQLPEEAVVRSARALLIDNWGMDGMIRAARIARQAGIPVIADFDFDDSPNFSELLALADHLIVSQRFAAKLVGDHDPAMLAQKLWTPDRQVVAITCGIEGAWYVSQSDEIARHQPAFPVNTVDSTGCGDVFHGAYAAALVRGFDVTARIRFAAAAAAIKATQPGGQTGIPSWDAVEAFLRERGQLLS